MFALAEHLNQQERIRTDESETQRKPEFPRLRDLKAELTLFGDNEIHLQVKYLSRTTENKE